MAIDEMQSTPAYLWPSLVFLLVAWNAPEFGGLEPYDQQRLLQILCFATTSACLLLIPSAREAADRTLSHVRDSHFRLMASALALGLCSAVTSELPKWSTIEWMMAVQLLVVAVAVATARLIAREATDAALLGVICLGAAAYSTILVIDYVSIVLTNDAIDLAAIYPRFSNPRFAGQMFTLVLPLLITASCQPGKFRHWAAVSAVVLFSFSLSQGTRGTWLSLAVGAAAVTAVRPNDYRRYLRRFASVVFLGAVAYLVQIQAPEMLGKEVVTGLSRAASVHALTHDSGRLGIWHSAAAEAMHRPLLGIGPMNLAAMHDGVVNHPHNIALQLAAEWGIPAALALIVLFSSLLVQVIRTSRAVPGPSQALLLCGLLASLAGGSVQSLLDGVLVVPTSQMTLLILAGWAAGIIASSQPTTGVASTQGSVAVRYVTAACVVATAVGLLAAAIRPAHKPATLQKYYCIEMRPRFWVNGAIGPSDFPGRRNTCKTANSSDN